MRVIDLRGQNLSRTELLAAMPRAAVGIPEATDLMCPILDDVRKRGAATLRNFGEKLNHVRLKNLRVPVEAIKSAPTTLDPEVRAVTEGSVRRARAAAANQVPKDFYTDPAEGARVVERWIPVRRVGLYVPGGKAIYPNSAIIDAVPAQAAGVESLAIVTPSARDNKEGLPDKTILVTCTILDVDGVYAVGDAQAIVMFAYGAGSSKPQDNDILCDLIDKITGPGNIFVVTAKSLIPVFAGIDMVAGSIEIGIIADEIANPSSLAADLIGQAEYDELASSVLFTDSTEIADKVQESLKYRVPRTEHTGHAHASLSDTQSAIVLTDGPDQSIDAANVYTAEHLEIQTKGTDAVVKRIKNVGAALRGPCSSVPLGDYMSSFNHVLPIGGTARFAVGLDVYTFMKPVGVIECDEGDLKAFAVRINAFVVSKDLPAHGECMPPRPVKDLYDKTTLRKQKKEAGL